MRSKRINTGAAGMTSIICPVAPVMTARVFGTGFRRWIYWSHVLIHSRTPIVWRAIATVA